MTHMRKCLDTFTIIGYHAFASCPCMIFRGRVIVTRKLDYQKKKFIWKFMEDVGFLWLYDCPRPYWWSLKVDDGEQFRGCRSEMGLM
jgi:hypothetical protein